MRKRLEERYPYESSRILGNDLGNVWAFSETMEEKDIVLFQGHQDDVYIVQVGPYEYIERYDDEEGMAHQRKYVLIKIADRQALSSKLQELLHNRSAITKFKYPLEEAELDFLESDLPFKSNSKMDVKSDALQEA